MQPTILYIDDDSEDLELFIAAVAAINPQVRCLLASSSTIALEVLTARSNDIHLIFLDVNMPMVNGWEFLRIVKSNENWKSIPVVVFSTTNQPHDHKKAIEYGAEQFV